MSGTHAVTSRVLNHKHFEYPVWILCLRPTIIIMLCSRANYYKGREFLALLNTNIIQRFTQLAMHALVCKLCRSSWVAKPLCYSISRAPGLVSDWERGQSSVCLYYVWVPVSLTPSTVIICLMTSANWSTISGRRLHSRCLVVGWNDNKNATMIFMITCFK